MEKFNQNKRKGICLIILFVLISFFAFTATAQRYRHGTYKVSYKQFGFTVSPINDDGKLKQLKVVSNDDIMFSFYVIDMVTVFKDGSTLTFRNNPPENGQNVFTTYFDVNKKNRSVLLNKEINFWELRFRNGKYIKKMCLSPNFLTYSHGVSTEK